MNTEIIVKPFLFEGEGLVRALHHDVIGFVGIDVAARLGYSDTKQAVANHCKHAIPLSEWLQRHPLPEKGCRIDTPSLVQPNTKIIPEGDVFRLIVRSKLPSAEKFESWVMDEVLPSLRATGRYETPAANSAAEAAPSDYRSKLDHVNLVLRMCGPRTALRAYRELKLLHVDEMEEDAWDLEMKKRIERDALMHKLAQGHGRRRKGQSG